MWSSHPTRHAGADLLDYKPYLEREFHDEFDRWAADFRDVWSGYDVEMMDTDDEHIRIGAASFLSPDNLGQRPAPGAHEPDGIAAEVVFPNTVPPFYPSGVISAPAPATVEDFRRRWIGLKAHNRWLVDFCAQANERRAGIAQVLLNDIDDAYPRRCVGRRRSGWLECSFRRTTSANWSTSIEPRPRPLLGDVQ